MELVNDVAESQAVKKTLDFFVIGAQKSGTTSLFKHLNQHPGLHLPREKEAPFFSIDEKWDKGLDWYLTEYFLNANPDVLWGTVTPDYMVYPTVPERLKETCADAKLIAILREPIERAFSEYRMNCKRGLESRAFETALLELLEPANQETARLSPAPQTSYLIRGEYGRILTTFAELFPPQNIKIVYLETLKSRPRETLRELFEFLEVDVSFVPSNLDERYHVGGSSERFPILSKVARVAFIRNSLRRFFGRRRHAIAYWFGQWNTKSEEQSYTLSAETQLALMKHFSKDADQLQQFASVPPWLKTYNKAIS